MQPGLNAPLANQNRIDPDVGMTSQQPGTNPGQSLDMQQTINQAPVSRQQQHQQLLQGSPKMPSALPRGPSGATIPQVPGPSISNSNPMLGSAGINGPGGPTGTLQTDMCSNSQRWQQPQQLTSQNQMLYHQQQQVVHQKLQQHLQQKQRQQTLMHMSSVLAGGSGMISTAPTGGMQQCQLSSVQQQPVGQGGSFQQQNLMQEQQQRPQATMQNPTIPTLQTNNLAYLQQQQLEIQQNQMQQSQVQQNLWQQNQMLKQQMLLGQQQNQMMGSEGGSMNNMQRQMQRQLLLQQQQQLLLPRLQSQQQQLPEQQQPSMMQQRETQMQQQPFQGSSALLQIQNSSAIDPQRQQQQQFIPQQQQPQQQRGLPDGASSSASMGITAQTGNPGDWQEEIYQQLKYLKDTYLADLREIHRKLSIKLSQLDNVVLASATGGNQVDKMKQFKLVLERMMAVLQLDKQALQIGLKDKLALYERQILSILQNHKKVPQQQPQAGVSSAQPQFPPLRSLPRKCKICEDCVHKRRNS